MNSRPPEQVFSSELIYQVINAVRLFNTQVNSSRKALEEKLHCEISEFYLIQRRWADCNKQQESDHQPWFDYSYYALNRFGEENNELLNNLVRSFDSSSLFSDYWETFFKYLKDHTSAKAVRSAEDWIHQNRNRLLNLIGTEGSKIELSDRILLHHHLLQLYSRFPTRRYIHGGLYNEFINNASQDAQTAEAYYVFLSDFDEKPISYPPYLVWGLRHDDDPEMRSKGRGSEQFVDGDPRTASLEEQSSVKFFNQYLSPIFNEPNFDGQDFFDIKKSHIDSMLWLPLFDEYVDGRFHGFFRGWLFQVLSLQPGINKTQAEAALHLSGGDSGNERYRVLREYAFSCLNSTHSLASDLNRAVIREVTNQVTFENPSYEILSNNLSLLGDWDVTITRGLEKTTKDEFAKLDGFVDDDKNKPTDLSINLDPPFLEKESDTFVSFDKINEDSTREHRELFLKFGKDFRRPEGDASVYYIQLVNYIYLIFTRLKNAKWAEIQSHEKGQVEEAKAQVGRWAHALQTKLARLEEIFGKEGGASITDQAVRINIEKSLRALRQTITTLSYYQRIMDYLHVRKTNLRELSTQLDQTFPNYTRSLGHMLLDAFSLMVAKVNLKEGRYGQIERKLPEFYKICEAKTISSLLKDGAEDHAAVARELTTFFPNDQSVSFELDPNDIAILGDYAIWADIPIETGQGEIKFNFAVAVSVVIDEILSNACKYVGRVDGKASISIKLSVETDHMGKWAVFETVNTAAYQELAVELGEKRDLIDYEGKKTAKGLGLFFNRELCEMLVGDSRKNYTVTVAKNLRSVQSRFRFPIGVSTEMR